ncbi:MAG: hypothetical protein ACI9UV_002791 [Algoriphagus sp.]|jgi:hypothetical protein
MANETNNLDQFFKEKFDQDSINPSKLAWERLESQLPQQEKTRTPFIWWSIAASVAALFIVGYFGFTLSSDPAEPQLLATTEENQIEEVIQQSEEIQSQTIEEIPAEIEEKTLAQPEKETKPTNSTIKKSASTNVNSTSSKLIAVAEVKPEDSNSTEQLEATPIVEELNVPALELPSLQLNQTVATKEKSQVEEPAYRVKIYSDGLEEDKTLIASISKKVGKVEGLLGKVDQGFADLQDAKSSLFTSLLSKKEKSADLP